MLSTLHDDERNHNKIEWFMKHDNWFLDENIIHHLFTIIHCYEEFISLISLKLPRPTLNTRIKL